MTTSTPPFLQLSWSATALGSAFGGYNVYRRPSRAVAGAWSQIGAITVPSGYTPANVEAQHTLFNDYEAGWAVVNGQWGDGFDYAVTVLNNNPVLESALSTPVARTLQLVDTNPWVTCNAAPYLSFPIASLQQLDGADEPARTEYRIAGRNLAVTRTQIELPPRSWVIGMRVFARTGEDPARVWRAAAASGLAFAAHGLRGDRLIGTLEAPQSLPHEDVGLWTLQGRMLETGRDGDSTLQVADFDLPASAHTDGAASTITVADNALLNPTSVPFTLFYMGQVSNAASKYALAKINAGQGYALRTDAGGHMGFELNGSGGNGTVFDGAGVYNDRDHSIILVSATGAQTMYRDGVSAATGTIAYTGITNTDVLTLGAKSGGSAFMAQYGEAFGFYPRALNATELANLDQYLRGVPGVRAPAGASLFIDMRDLRTWDGTQSVATLLDLSGNALNGTLASAPVTRGIPWNLAQIDRF